MNWNVNTLYSSLDYFIVEYSQVSIFESCLLFTKKKSLYVNFLKQSYQIFLFTIFLKTSMSTDIFV